MTNKPDPIQLMKFVRQLHELCLGDVWNGEARGMRWLDAVLPPFDKDPNDDFAASWIEKLCDYYQGCDYVEDALTIAKIVACDDSQDEDTAEHLLNSIGYTLGMLLDWKLSPELQARAKQIPA